MTTWSFYRLDTGDFTGSSFSGREKYLHQNTPNGHGAVLGLHDMFTCRVNLNTGEVEAKEDTRDHSAEIALAVRAQRAAMLSASDWTQLPDAPLTEQELQEWRAYRQALRDVPEQDGFPVDIEWPAAPAGAPL
jgi:hypothetical protein